jgi:hypothetical protein
VVKGGFPAGAVRSGPEALAFCGGPSQRCRTGTDGSTVQIDLVHVTPLPSLAWLE